MKLLFSIYFIYLFISDFARQLLLLHLSQLLKLPLLVIHQLKLVPLFRDFVANVVLNMPVENSVVTADKLMSLSRFENILVSLLEKIVKNKT